MYLSRMDTLCRESRKEAVFYAGGRLVAARDPKTLPASFDILLSLFEQIELATNTTKTEVMVFLLRHIRTVPSEDTYVPLQNGHPSLGVQKGEAG